MTVISVASQKGGAGKTTTVLAIGQYMARAGLKVLYIDMDYQCSLTDMLGGLDASKKTIYDILTDDACRLSDARIGCGYGDYVAGSQMMAHLDVLLADADVKQTRLQKAIKDVSGDYDAILIDTPPALSLAQLMAIYAADTVIIPTQADRQHYQQLKSLIYTIGTAKEAGCGLTVYYIVTRYNPRVKINQAFNDAIEQMMDAEGIGYLGTVSDSSVIREAQGTDADLFTDYPKSKPAKEYGSIAEQIIKDIKPSKAVRKKVKD